MVPFMWCEVVSMNAAVLVGSRGWNGIGWCGSVAWFGAKAPNRTERTRAELKKTKSFGEKRDEEG